MINLIEDAKFLQGNIETKKRNKRRLILLLLLLLITAGLIALIVFAPEDPQMFIAGHTFPEGRQHAAELSEIMQEVADASQVSMQVNTVMDFETPTSHGNVGIINPPENIYPIAVDFILDETGEVIFTSGGLLPNEFISSARLDVELPVGVHQATAIFNAYDSETLDHIWYSNVSLTINIGQ